MRCDKRKTSLEKQLKALRQHLEKCSIEASKRSKYLQRPLRDFTRRRKLDFVTTVVFILGLLKKV